MVEMKDTKAIPLFEFFGKTGRTYSTMRRLAPEYLAALDSPAAMRALWNIAPNGMEQRAKLRDPIAADWALAKAERLVTPDADGIIWDCTFESGRMVDLVRALGCPDDEDVNKWWRDNRSAFVVRFTKKYGFVPEN